MRADKSLRSMDFMMNASGSMVQPMSGDIAQTYLTTWPSQQSSIIKYSVFMEVSVLQLIRLMKLGQSTESKKYPMTEQCAI